MHLFQFGGPLHLQLMGFWNVMGWGALAWSSPRNIFCAALVLSVSLFPYVYALSLVAFRGVPTTLEDAARSLGKSKSECFFRITLVMAGPQIVAALALVLMEVMADFGTVEHFAIETLTVGVYRAWFGLGSLAMAAQLSTLLLGLVAAVMLLRSFFLKWGKSYAPAPSAPRKRPLRRLSAPAGWIVLAALSCPFLLGFVFPVVSLTLLSLKSSWEGVFGLFGSNAALAALSAFLCLLLGSILAVTQRKRASGSSKTLESGLISFAIFGYAVPGAVLAVGVLLVFGAVEKFRLSPWGSFLLGLPLLSGTLGAMVYSYCVRFSSVPFHSISSALLNVSPRLTESARLLGSSALGALWKIEWPLIRGSVGSAFLFVFVDIVKELPASMLLRPFGFETLAVKTYLLASDERLAEAAPAALMVILVGLLPLLMLSKRLLKVEES